MSFTVLFKNERLHLHLILCLCSYQWIFDQTGCIFDLERERFWPVWGSHCQIGPEKKLQRNWDGFSDVSGSRSFHGCWWPQLTVSFSFTTWIHWMEASACWPMNTGEATAEERQDGWWAWNFTRRREEKNLSDLIFEFDLKKRFDTDAVIQHSFNPKFCFWKCFTWFFTCL